MKQRIAQTKRLILAVGLMALVLPAGAAVASEDESEQTIVKPREFTIPRGQCSQLPPYLELHGQGIERTKIEIDRGEQGEKQGGERHEADKHDSGVSYSVSTSITGTATDNFGGRYTFRYQLHLLSPIPGTGMATDRFKLTGNGEANGLSTFFTARVTFDSAFNFVGGEFLQQVGDPLHCDPL